MATLTRDEQETPAAEPASQPAPASPLSALSNIRTLHWWLMGIAAILIVLVVSLLIWGPEMDYPTTVAYSTSSDGTTQFPQSLRNVTGGAIDDGARWLTVEGSWLFGGIKAGVIYALNVIEDVLKWLPWPAVVLGLALASFAVGRWAFMAFTTFALLFIGFMDLWENAIETIALMAVAVVLSVGIGLPLGVFGARSQTADRIMRPILDGMQTMPSFVYLLPGILFFGLGKPAGIFATIIYAVPPVIRLTNLGIRQVSPETVEAARSFGASPLQLLSKVQVPMALPTIMAGINQTTMLALSMVTIASMVAAGGLGDNVLRAIQKNEVGNGIIAGFGIVFMAIVIDRLTQSVARSRQEALSAGH